MGGAIADGRRRGPVPRVVARWWGRPFAYERARAFGDAVIEMDLLRRGIAVSMVAVVVASLTALASPVGPDAPASVAVLLVSLAASVAVGVAWWRGPWPSESTSLAFVAFADLSIAVGLLLYSDPLLALPGTCLFVVVGLYVVLLHTPAHVLGHVAVASATSTVLLARVVVTDGDVPIAVSMWIALQGGLVGLPLMLFGAWAPVRQAAWESMTDPLTGLVNRRGLDILGPRLPRPGVGEALVVAVLDLDHFKRINDEAGHAAGDEVLVRAAERLLSTRPQVTVVARTGGEEFVCLATVAAGREATLGAALTRVVNDPSDRHPVTASVGIARVDHGPRRAALAAAVARADAAMYRAKRRGRNGYVVDGSVDAPPLPVAARRSFRRSR